MSDHPHIFSSESVTEGHPDKIADQVSDAVLDAMLAGDASSRVACETLVTTGMVMLAGEITSATRANLSDVVRERVRAIGYTDGAYGLDADTCAVLTSIDPQSGDIAMGVDTGGAGDQGMMFGYACDETPELMPLPIMLAHGLTKRLAALRHDGTLEWLRPDGKAQVAVRYEERRPVGIEAVVVSTQHDPDVTQSEITDAVVAQVITPVLADYGFGGDGVKFHINPTGRFVTGGPQGDAGLTGRKIIVDTYGGAARHGGGAFSGKDPSKVDRSAAYAARWVAKHVVAAKLARRCEVQVAYAIGVADPVSVMIDTFGTGVLDGTHLERAVQEVFDLTPRGIMESLDLRKPIYTPTAAYGHFGREAGAGSDAGTTFSWEALTRVDELASAARQTT